MQTFQKLSRNKGKQNTHKGDAAKKRTPPKAKRGLVRWIIFNHGGKRVYVKASKVKPKYRGKNKRLKVRPGLARADWSGALVRLGSKNANLGNQG